jgi:DNA invertase Pin-like site-specific DNA recombinase
MASQHIPSTKRLIDKRVKRAKTLVSDVPAHLRYLEDEFGISFAKEGRWNRNRLRSEELAAQRAQGASLLLSYGRNSSRVGIRSSSDLRQSEEVILICETHRLGDAADIIEFFDYGISGASRNRPELDRLIEVVNANFGCVLIVEDVDRLVRDDLSLLHIGHALASGGVKIFNLEGEVTWKAFIKRGLEAAAERDRTKKRGNPRRRQNIREGAHYARPPFGYVKHVKGHLEVGPKAKLVKQMYKKYLAGDSLAEIGRWLAGNGAMSASGVAWQPSYVREILEREIHIGIIKTEFEPGDVCRTDHPHLRIVQERDFATVQRLILDRAVERSTKQKIALPFKGVKTYVLSGKCRCARCGARLDAFMHSADCATVLRCARRRSHTCDAQESFDYRDVETAILRVLRSRLTPDFDELYLKSEREMYEQRTLGNDEKRRWLDGVIARLGRNIETIGEREEGQLLSNSLAKLEAALEKRKKERDQLESDIFLGYANSKLSSLSHELELIEQRSPFRPQNNREVGLATHFARIIQNVVVDRLDENQVSVRFDLDFSDELGREADSVVLKESTTYVRARTIRVTEQELVASRGPSLGVTDAEFSLLMRLPWLAVQVEKVGKAKLRTALDVLAVAMDLNTSLRHTITGLKLGPSYDVVKRVVDALRNSAAFEEACDIISESRGVLHGRDRVVIRKRPNRRARARLAKVNHELLELQLAQPAGIDRDLSQDEWDAVRSDILAAMGSQLKPNVRYFLFKKETLRQLLNDLFRILRSDLTAWSTVGSTRAAGFYSSLDKAKDRGYLDIAVRTLKRFETTPGKL